MLSRQCYIPNMEALGLVVSDKKILENCILKTYFLPRDLHMQPFITIWTVVVGDHPDTIPVEFGKIPISGSREDVIWTFPYKFNVKLWPPGRGKFWPQGHNLNNFSRGPLDDAIYKIWKLWALLFQTRRFVKIAIWKPIFDPVTYLYNQLELFEQLCLRNT